MRHFFHRSVYALCSLVGFSIQVAVSQDAIDPLTIQGLDQSAYTSARARAMGGTTAAVGNDVSAMFANPAILLTLTGPEVRVGGYYSGSRYQQRQEWVPNRFYGGLSLMFEDLLDGVKDPEPLPPNRADRVQRPYDNLGPNWSKKTSDFRPSLAAFGLPFLIADVKVAAAIGYSEVANLNSFLQNNNVLSPNIGLYRPEPTPIVTVGDSLEADWYQFIRQRSGTLNGVTPALSIEVAEGFSVGASATILFGSSDDFEQRIDRGHLVFLYDKFRSDSVYHHVTMSGNSKYKGVLPMIGGMLREETFSLGLSIRLPMTITRDWNRSVRVDTTGRSTTFTENGSDKLRLPVQITIGGALHPSPKWDVSVDYDIRNYGDVRFTQQSGSTTNPWLGSQNVRAGVEYRAETWLAVRGGFRQVSQTFAAAGAALVDEPFSASAYSAGIGVKFNQLSFDIAYEYAHLRYEDAWQSNVNYNRNSTHTVWFETGIQL